MTGAHLLDADAIRRGAWLAVGLLGLPALLIGLLYLIGFPLAAVSACLGFVAGRSWALQRVAIAIASPLFFYFLVAVAGTSLGEFSPGDLLFGLSVVCAFLATYKVGNVARVRLFDAHL